MAIVKRIGYRETLESMSEGEELELLVKDVSRNAFVIAGKRIGDEDERAGRPRRVFSTRMDKANRLKFYLKRVR